jgi:UDP-GlcNAc:undecaprenyl-phosphate/decaprenyl-phosphate GlcNAc-1-phosphate transferase
MQMALGGAVGFGVALIVTRLVELTARRRHLLDVPDARSTHLVPVPRIGGIGIIVGSLAAYAVVGGPVNLTMVAVLVGGVIISVVGLVDDLRGASVPVKFSGQAIAATIAIVGLSPSLQFRLLDMHASVDGVLAAVVAAVWLTALLNAFNFMDGVDGLVATVTVVIAGLGLLLVGDAGRVMLVAIGASALGFLVWNHHPARIFMGDVGSQFLGYAVGCALLLEPDSRVDVVPVLLLVSPFLADTGFTLGRRAWRRKPLLRPHREHLYQRLTDRGVDQRIVAAAYGLATAACGIAALMWAD